MTHDYILAPHIAAIIRDCIEIRLKTPDDFLKVKETLTRIGVASKKERTLYQSCHILHKQGHYYLVHFKELFLLDGKNAQTRFETDDIARRNTIVNMLAEWGLVELVEPRKSAAPVAEPNAVTVIPFRAKQSWQLVAKYEIGKRRPNEE
jgi:hypothetical protein